MAIKKKEATKKKEEEEKTDIGSKELDSALKSIQERFGEGSIMRLGDAQRVDVDVIPTGSFSLDIALGVGGIPRGRIIEIFGPEATGKTTLALHIVAEAQKKGGIAAYIDAEHALDPAYSRRIGVKVDELLLSQPDSGEQALDITETLVKSGSVDVIVIDSVAALTPQRELEGAMGDTHIGLQARLMSQALRKLAAIVHRKNTTIIFINQIRMQIGVMFGNPETTPGGKALKFYSSVRIEVRRRAQIKHQEQIIGNRIKAKIVKNKVAAPFKVVEFDIMYGQGISYEGDVLSVAIDHGVVKKSGSWYTYGDESLGQGMEGARDYVKEHKKTLSAIKKDVLAKMKEQG